MKTAREAPEADTPVSTDADNDVRGSLVEKETVDDNDDTGVDAAHVFDWNAGAATLESFCGNSSFNEIF